MRGGVVGVVLVGVIARLFFRNARAETATLASGTTGTVRVVPYDPNENNTQVAKIRALTIRAYEFSTLAVSYFAC